ncbi:MAG: transcriptional regulator GlxA family with amidase domain [Hyphomicrobiaceae bacterium]|jgi:transcriptional regulator GlxA family with amidase domain
MSHTQKKRLGILLFEGFETLDVFGPVEMLGHLDETLELTTVAESAGPIASHQGPRTYADSSLEECPKLDLLLIPGGKGTRRDVNNTRLIDWLTTRATQAELVMTVCTGTALLARTKLLDGKRATTNKLAFEWVASQGPNVEWVKQARWVVDGKFNTSSGVSAGIDMALDVIRRLYDEATAQFIADVTEYEWHRDAEWDPFAKFAGLT